MSRSQPVCLTLMSFRSIAWQPIIIRAVQTTVFASQVVMVYHNHDPRLVIAPRRRFSLPPTHPRNYSCQGTPGFDNLCRPCDVQPWRISSVAFARLSTCQLYMGNAIDSHHQPYDPSSPHPHLDSFCVFATILSWFISSLIYLSVTNHVR